MGRAQVRGKFIEVNARKFYVRGVTYGPFRPDAQKCEYHTPEIVDRDFALMARSNINTVRVYTLPPTWLLDLAEKHGLKVMIGLPWEQHVTFLDDSARCRRIELKVRDDVRTCAGHPAILCFVIGNEIPAPIVRWHGAHKVGRFLHRLYKAVKEEDPGALVTYVNYPTTEYLSLDFVDFVCFNVYLESREKLDSYLARLQNLADEKPLVLAEVGLDSLRNGLYKQSRTLTWQIEAIFAAGAAGMFVFAWTDEWHRGGQDIDDWRFGLTDSNRVPKPALTAVRDAFAQVPFPNDVDWPRVSIVCCTYNGSRTLADTCQGIKELDYPDYEVIVVNDGSKDNCAEIASSFGFQVISIPNGGLSNARNVGMKAANGQIVAYIDDDARPDPHWLKYLAWTFITGKFAGVGGPNLAPAGDGLVADCVANSPGGPIHVLLDDRVAEHIPGCNMAFRRRCLKIIDGFDGKFRIAGDDVDLCWRIQEMGWTLGFSPSAVVWHHRRNEVKTYWKQQVNYGRAEAMLERKWPMKYNAAGHVPWAGRLYGKGSIPSLLTFRNRIYHGTWGSAPFQLLYEPNPGVISSLPMMPEWYLITTALMLISALGWSWPPLFAAVPLLCLSLLFPMMQAVIGARRAQFADAPRSRIEDLRKRCLTAILHFIQPFARLRGRLHLGLTPWRRLHGAHLAVPRDREVTLWSEDWVDPQGRLQVLLYELRNLGAVALYGGPYDDWDLRIRGGLFGAVRVKSTTEEHGGGKQLTRIKAVPVWRRVGGIVGIVIGLAAFGAFHAGAWTAAVMLGLATLFIAGRGIYECAVAMGFLQAGLDGLQRFQDALEKVRTESVPLGWPDDLAESNVTPPEIVVNSDSIEYQTSAAGE